MFKRFIPHSVEFFNFFDEHAVLLVEAAAKFKEIVSQDTLKLPFSGVIKDIEHKADGVTRQCIEAIHNTFITPIDREDIFRLIKGMDDIVDSIDEAFEKIEIYRLNKMNEDIRKFADVNLRAAFAVQKAVHGLRKPDEEVVKQCNIIFDLEHEADFIQRLALEKLFEEEADLRLVIKWKEVFDNLECATDNCNHLADIIRGILIEQA